ncbi:MAG: class I SAM-dependent methyltransferase [Chloroflexaceae bacterium]|nr:class I SAM-dependent methyltransferase [Chloroflexaceae bacterium]
MTARYDAIADWYTSWVQDAAAAANGALVAFLELIGDVRGQQVCDVGCGQGRVTRLVAERGAHMHGVDLSAAMLAVARQHEAATPLAIQYTCDDARFLTSMADQMFDGVVSFMAISDMPDLTFVCRAMARVLRPAGWCAVAVTHPCFEAPHAVWSQTAEGKPRREIVGYFDEGYWESQNSQGLRGQVGAYHYTLATYFNSFLAAGFRLEHVAEPRYTGAAVEKMPGYGVMPSVLLLRWKRVV